MKLVENPMIQCDVMSFISLSQSHAVLCDKSLEMNEKQKIQRGLTLAGGIFCGVAIAFNEQKTVVDDVEYSYLLSPSMATIGEPNSRDGAYVYMTRNPGGFYEMPEPDSRIEDGICIYANFDINNPCVEFYYGETLICSVLIGDVPHMTMCDKNELKDEFMSEAYSLIEKNVQTAITQITITYMAGYKKGLDDMQKEGNNE